MDEFLFQFSTEGYACNKVEIIDFRAGECVLTNEDSFLLYIGLMQSICSRSWEWWWRWIHDISQRVSSSLCDGTEWDYDDERLDGMRWDVNGVMILLGTERSSRLESIHKEQKSRR